MITQAQRNAALLAAHAQVLNIVEHFVPVMFQAMAEGYINANPHLIANISDACLDAAEAARPSAPITVTVQGSPGVQHPST